MKNDKDTILDHIEGIEVPGDVFVNPANEYWALVCLRQGLEFLHRQVADLDRITREGLNPEDGFRCLSFGNDPRTTQIPKSLLTCAFHWYAVSACQYVRTVGAIAYRQDNSRPIPPEYVRSVIPDVLAFRDKVAAHFAWTTEHSKDNDAERVASILPPLAFVNDSWHVGVMQVSLTRSGKGSSSASMRPWGISDVHLRLVKRFWPERLEEGLTVKGIAEQ